ncbi:hypothetical protein [Streptomyces sp. NPDC017940]|uniref:hypothetical protein n=1 Tax=Streptomyces sp. NPDC017940 TaxID=3365017 RepID=UPI00379363F7
MRLRLPEERLAEPPTGYKIAHPVLSQDGTRAGFTGVSLGGSLPYGAFDEAHCAYGRRHRAPHRRCDCGFHCVHERSAAEGLLCTAEHRGAALLEVAVLGAYIRFEKGFRYARQRVRVVTVQPCGCGAAATGLADAGWGRPGWRALAAVCGACGRGGGGTAVSLPRFAAVAGEGLRVLPAPATAPGGAGAVPGPAPGSSPGPFGAATADVGLPELAAEAALLQARLDWFQVELGRIGGQGQGGNGRERA